MKWREHQNESVGKTECEIAKGRVSTLCNGSEPKPGKSLQ